MIFVAFFPCGPVCARYLRRYAREEQRHEHCCAWPCGRAVLSVCTHLIYSQVAVYCCAGAQLSLFRYVVTVRSSRRSPFDPRPVAVRAGSASEGGVAHTHTSTHAHTRTHTDTQPCTHAHACTHARTAAAGTAGTHAHEQTRPPARTHEATQVHAHTHTSTHAHTRTHTDTQLCTHARACTHARTAAAGTAAAGTAARAAAALAVRHSHVAVPRLVSGASPTWRKPRLV